MIIFAVSILCVVMTGNTHRSYADRELQWLRPADGVIIPELTSSPRTSTELSVHPFHSPLILLDDSAEGSFFFNGEHGTIGLAFKFPISPSHIVIDQYPIPIHIPPSLSPRMFTLWGLVSPANLGGLSEVRTKDRHRGSTDKLVELLRFEFDPLISSKQSFLIQPHDTIRHMVFNVFVLEVLSNWGGPMTCLHRVRLFLPRRLIVSVFRHPLSEFLKLCQTV